MKKALNFFLFISLSLGGVSCSHYQDEGLRGPAEAGTRSCGDAIKLILSERKKQAQGRLIAEAKTKVSHWRELQNDDEVLEIIGRDLTGQRLEMALMSIAILKREYPNESMFRIGSRYRSLKKVCTGP